jgi:excisionase family DNA binding protein
MAKLTIRDLLDRGADTCRVEEAAEVLSISRGSAYKAARSGELPALKIGNRFLVPTRRLAALLGADGGEAQ